MVILDGTDLFPGAGDVWFSLNGTTYENNSIVALEDIGEWDYALFCRTTLDTCCRHTSVGNWYFPNGTRVLSSGNQWDFYRGRGQMVIYLNRRGGGVKGIYHCEIPDSMNIIQTIYIGVYTADTGELPCSLDMCPL